MTTRTLSDAEVRTAVVQYLELDGVLIHPEALTFSVSRDFEADGISETETPRVSATYTVRRRR